MVCAVGDFQHKTAMTRRAALIGVAATAGLTACSDDPVKKPADKPEQLAQPSASKTSSPPPLLELPRGGRAIFPTYQLFGFCGAPDSEALGRLGIGDIDTRIDEMLTVGEDYANERKIMPVLELITTIVHPKPGADGKFRSRQPNSVIDKYLEAARRHKALLLLNIQPGRAEFIDELKFFERYLKEPDVGVALDPEWAVQEGEIPGRVFGSTTGAALNECSEFLAGLVKEHRLPEKVMLYHQLHLSIVKNETALVSRPGVVLVKSIDGIGSAKDKTKTFNMIVAQTPKNVHVGFKLFYVEDKRSGPLMTPAEVMALQPAPEYVLYE